MLGTAVSSIGTRQERAHARGSVLPPAMSDAHLSPDVIGAGEAAPEEQAGYLLLRESAAAQAPAVAALDHILLRAISEGASDIHVQVEHQGLAVRYRVDGMMLDQQVMRADLAPALVSRIKIVSQMNVAEHRLPQDGRFTVQAGGRQFDIRASVVPGVRGEKAVLRLLPKSTDHLTLEGVGLDGAGLQTVRELTQRPHGMVLVTGPTGSGKTTTLYAALRGINHAGRNTITIEDPVEYELPWVTQIQVNPRIGLSFASGLRSVLRQDPDIVMVGEIRDAETLSITIQAALTGHLVFSTLHCNDAAGAAARCLDLGTEPFLFTSATSAIVAQRLVRRICPQCRESRTLPERAARALSIDAADAVCYVGRGCAACRQTGYRGRTAAFEVLRMTESVKTAIHRKETSATIRQIAVSEGMQTLRADAVRKMQAGITTPEEVLRAVYLED